MTKEVTIYKTVSISSAHKLNLPYESKCNRVHGHNYRIETWLRGYLDEHGMVIDFHELKKVIFELDHINLNDLLEVETTAENIAIYLADEIYDLAPERLKWVRVRVHETESAYAEYTKQS
jgi:6-pyruvoyltetrahydropterin/6-carboxytetrahydropterin synthase